MASDKTKVFISWSGELAKRVASVWRDLLGIMFDTVQPFMSEEDIGAGERNLGRIANELAGTNFGIVVVTQDNQNSRWLNYEAGALSKNVESKNAEGDLAARVVPSLVDFARAGDVERPLGQFQGKILNQKGIRDTLVAVAEVAGAREASVVARFDSLWDTEYKDRFNRAKEGAHTTKPPARKPDDMVEEILTIVRSSPPLATTEEILTLVRDMHRVAKFGEAPMERGLRLPIDLPLDEIRTAVASVLGEDHNCPITLTCNENCELIVEVHIQGAVQSVGARMPAIGEALLKVKGVYGCSVPFSPEPHMPPAYKEWAEAVKREVSAKRSAGDI
ncbi:hypothetical protein [Mycobacterium haemophilum]